MSTQSSLAGVIKYITRVSWSQLSTVFVVGLATVVLIQNFTLLREVRSSRLKSAITNLQSGRRISQISGISTNGTLRRITFPLKDVGRLLVVTLSANCPTCKENQSRYNLLAAEMRKRSGWAIIWVSRSDLKSTAQYAMGNGIPINELIAEPLHTSYQALGLDIVPHMAVLDQYGVVQGVWQGRQPWSENDVITLKDVK